MTYADTSFLLAARVRRDSFHKVALKFYEAHQDQLALAGGSGLKALRPG